MHLTEPVPVETSEEVKPTPINLADLEKQAEDLLANDNYLKLVDQNLQENSSREIFSAPNVFSVHGLLRQLRDTYTDALFINPGTSLDTKLEELKLRITDQTVVFCSDVCLQGMLAEGIRVDFVVTVDPNPKTSYFMSGLKDIKPQVIAASSSPLYLYYTHDKDFFLYNSLEENSDYKVTLLPQDYENAYQRLSYFVMSKKAAAILRSHREMGVLRKYPDFLARGTVAVTMFQIFYQLKLPSAFYGFDFYIKENQPYAKFISEANHQVFSKDIPDFSMTHDEYVSRIVKSYYNGDMTDEVLAQVKHDHPDYGTLYAPPLLDLYKTLFMEYVKMVKPFGKSLDFVV